MANVAKLTDNNSESGIRWWCPGCEGMHVVPIDGPQAWGWNGSLTEPTLTPSVLVYGHLRSPAFGPGPQPRCHSFIRGGCIEFLSDCEHGLAGQTVPMRPEPTL